MVYVMTSPKTQRSVTKALCVQCNRSTIVETVILFMAIYSRSLSATGSLNVRHVQRLESHYSFACSEIPLPACRVQPQPRAPQEQNIQGLLAFCCMPRPVDDQPGRRKEERTISSNIKLLASASKYRISFAFERAFPGNA